MNSITLESETDVRPENAIMLSQLKRGLNTDESMFVVSMMIREVRDWFNVKGNMTDKQIAMTAKMILDYPDFYDLSLGNIKSCFQKRMMSEKLYDRLDGNIIITWLKEFKRNMSESCYETAERNHSRYKEQRESETMTDILHQKAVEFFKYKTEYESKKKKGL